MKKLKKFLFAAFTVAILSCLLCQPAFAAISESDVQAQVDAVGKEAVSGNVFIWFLCAIGFLKVGQKIDSFLSSLGVNVGHTGGRITGTEVTAEHPEGISFGMYHADQYVAPEGQYTTVHAVDGTAWYKQYAVDAVDKSPYMAPDGSIAFNESIVKKLPPAPRRKDKI